MQAKHNTVSFLVPHVQSAARTIIVIPAIKAYPCFSPPAIPHDFKTIVPYVKKIVFVDIPLNKASVNIGTRGNGTVKQN
jgi:hypothetical protein